MEDRNYMRIMYGAEGDSQPCRGIVEELNGLNGNFDKIKIPFGGSLMFEAPGPDGEPRLLKEIKGVILYHHPVNSFYKDEYRGGNNPPDCGSMDGKFGIGTPGGICRDCLSNKFGSRREGRGKACKNKRRIFILREGEILPVLLTLPSGSLKEFSGYIKKLLANGKMSFLAVTKIELIRAQNKSGMNFSQAVFSHIRDLSIEEIKSILPIVEYVKDYSANIALDMDK